MRYTIFSGSNRFSEAVLALEALSGRTPLDEGPAIAEFEHAFAAAVGTRFAVSFAAGRMGLYALLQALGIGPGDEVILPAFTCVVVPNAVLYRGARPVYVDIDARSFNLDPDLLESKITSRTKAIIAQHTFGLICDIDRISAIARRHGVPVLEDCAHALGAKLRGRPAGSLATAAFFSIDHTKMIGTGTGGIVTTDDPRLAGALTTIQNQAPFLPASQIRQVLAAFVGEVFLLHPRVYFVGKYLYVIIRRVFLRRAFFCDELDVVRPTGYPYPAKLSNAQARIGLSQLDSLHANVAWRRSVACRYEAVLGACRGLLEPGEENHSFLRYTFLVSDRTAWEHHFAPVLDMATWFTSVAHGRDRNLAEIGYDTGSCPKAEMAAANCVNLPTHPRVQSVARLLKLLREARHSTSPSLTILCEPLVPNVR